MILIWYSFIIGSVMGSFTNVAGLRLPKKESLVYPASHCPSCRRSIAKKDLIPIVSYFILQGKCRFCKKSISFLYPCMELTAGILFAAAFLRFGWEWELALVLIVVLVLCTAVVSDLAYMIIPDRLLLTGTGAAAAVKMAAGPFSELLSSAWQSLLIFALLYIFALLTKGGLGGGDIKLFAFIAFAVGWPAAVLTIFLAAIAGTTWGIFRLCTKKMNRRQLFPFAPFIAFACITAVFAGGTFYIWYSHLIGLPSSIPL